MRVALPVFLLSFLLALATGCTPKPSNHHKRILAFGTIIDITVRHHNPVLVSRVLERLESDFHTMHRFWHPWEPGSLNRANQLLQTGEWFSAAPSVLPLISRSRELAIRSGHYFNPAIGKLVRLWGFHRNDPNEPFIPDHDEIRRLQSNIPTMEAIEMDGIRLRGHHPDIQVDSGGIAKGMGIDRAVQTLKSMGISHAIINAGGDLRTIGKHSNRPWKVGIRHPRKNQVLASIETLEDESIFTSGDYQRYYIDDNQQRRGHIIDPFTGIPVNHTMAVTVIHTDATTADAAATALMAAGPEHWYRVARKLGINYVLLLAADGKLHMNPAMQKRLIFSDSSQLNLQLSRPLM